MEQPYYVVCEQDEFQDDVLQFHETIEDCLEHGEIDVIFCSSVLEYLYSPYAMRASFANSGAPYIFLDRTPSIKREQDRLTIQHVSPEIYPASYPTWFFSRKRFAEEMEKAGYRKVVCFDAEDDVGIGRFEETLFERI